MGNWFGWSLALGCLLFISGMSFKEQKMTHRCKWLWVDCLNGVFGVILVLYKVPWYVVIPGIVIVALLNYIDGCTSNK